MGQGRQGGATDRDIIVADIVARTGIDEAMIERLVRTFYGRARRDPLIGPVFETHVADWDRHIQRICAFWSSVALMSGRYHGQPMAVHLPLPIDTPHFDRWLELFAATAREICPPAAAAHFVERAHRIADSLELGLAAQNGEIKPRRDRPAATFLPDDIPDAAAPAELVAFLNELLEAERAGARVTRDSAREAAAGPLADLMRAIERDEAHWCAMLARHLKALGEKPSARVGAFYDKAMAVADLGARTTFLNRGQGWVVRKLREMLPRVRDMALHADLAEMLRSHEANIDLAYKVAAQTASPPTQP